MKSIKLILASMLCLTLAFSCKNNTSAEKAEVSTAKEATATKATAAGAQNMPVIITGSEINWTGSKIAGKHSGVIGLSKGNIELSGDKVTGGSFVIDMNSIKNTDMPAAEGGDKLVAHLKNADFFDVEKHPTAEFKINKITDLKGNATANSMVYGNLTVKGIAKEVGFKANIVTSESGVKVSSEDFAIDRTEFGIQYGSDKFFDNLKDKAISDEIVLSINVTAKKS